MVIVPSPGGSFCSSHLELQRCVQICLQPGRCPERDGTARFWPNSATCVSSATLEVTPRTLLQRLRPGSVPAPPRSAQGGAGRAAGSTRLSASARALRLAVPAALRRSARAPELGRGEAGFRRRASARARLGRTAPAARGAAGWSAPREARARLCAARAGGASAAGRGWAVRDLEPAAERRRPGARDAGAGGVREALGHRQRRLRSPWGLRAVPEAAVVRAGPSRGSARPAVFFTAPRCVAAIVWAAARRSGPAERAGPPPFASLASRSGAVRFPHRSVPRVRAVLPPTFAVRFLQVGRHPGAVRRAQGAVRLPGRSAAARLPAGAAGPAGRHHLHAVRPRVRQHARYEVRADPELCASRRLESVRVLLFWSCHV